MEQSIENLYKLDGRVPVGKAVPFGLQHVLAMFVSNIAPIMILAGAVGLDSQVSAVLIQNCMVIAVIGTLVLIGAVIVGGLVEGTLGLFAKYWIKLIPHIVAATVVTAIGFSLLPVLVGLVVGYILACFMGMVNFSGLSNQAVVSLPHLLPFTPEFNIGTIFSVVAVYLVSATETSVILRPFATVP